jgi:hypothetical protein
MRIVLLLLVAALSLAVLARYAWDTVAGRRMRRDFTEWDITSVAGA